jgi:hypothetical protein
MHPLVTPRGKPLNDGTCVATPAVPVKGAAVGAWMCAAVVIPIRSKKVAWTLIVWATASISTIANPVPGEALGGTSLGPSRLAV